MRFLLVFWFLLGLVWFLRFAFASLHAFVSSLTGAQRTDSSPASKKKLKDANELYKQLRATQDTNSDSGRHS